MSEHLDDLARDGVGENLEELRFFDVAVRVDVLHQHVRQVVQVTRHHFHRKQQHHAQPVERVVHRRTGEGAPELVTRRNMADRHDGVGDAGSDVGAHDDEDGVTNGDDCSHEHKIM